MDQMAYKRTNCVVYIIILVQIMLYQLVEACKGVLCGPGVGSMQLCQVSFTVKSIYAAGHDSLYNY